MRIRSKWCDQEDHAEVFEGVKEKGTYEGCRNWGGLPGGSEPGVNQAVQWRGCEGFPGTQNIIMTCGQ